MYPNPVSGTATFEFYSDNTGKIELVIFDVMGRWVEVVEDQLQITGTHQIYIETTDMAPGM